jgi:hypothetical protein
MLALLPVGQKILCIAENAGSIASVTAVNGTDTFSQNGITLQDYYPLGVAVALGGQARVRRRCVGARPR